MESRTTSEARTTDVCMCDTCVEHREDRLRNLARLSGITFEKLKQVLDDKRRERDARKSD